MLFAVSVAEVVVVLRVVDGVLVVTVYLVLRRVHEHLVVRYWSWILIESSIECVLLGNV